MFFSRKEPAHGRVATRPHVSRTPWRLVAASLLSAPLVVGTSVSVDAWAAPEQQADERPAFSRRVDLATVNVAVLDRHGLPVGDLTSADFVVREDGIEHDVAIILTPQDTPLEVALAIDISGSMLGSGWERDAADFLEALAPADCVYFYAFRQDVIPGFWASPGSPGLWEVLASGEPGEGTGLYDALIYGLLQLSTSSGETLLRDLNLLPAEPFPGVHPGGRPTSSCDPVDRDAGTWRRRALFVLTDGRDARSVSYGEEDVAIAANLVRVPIFPVGTLQSMRRASNVANAALEKPGRRPISASRRTRSLGKLARMTGGHEIARSSSSLADLVARLKGTYVLGYYRKSQDTTAEEREFVEHDIDVELRRSGLKLFAQTGYFRHTVNKSAARSALGAGVDMMDQDQVDTALLAFDQAIQADPLSADGYHQRAIAYARLERFEEARDDALRAAELQPGVGSLHQLAARLALRLGDHASSWDQAILANRAGSDTGAIFRELREVSDEPQDLAERLGTLRVFVSTSNIRSFRTRAALPKIERRWRLALARSGSLAVVDRRDTADLVFSLDVESLDNGRTRQARGRVQVTDPTGSEPLEEITFRISDIDDGPRTTRELSAYVDELITKIREALGR